MGNLDSFSETMLGEKSHGQLNSLHSEGQKTQTNHRERHNSMKWSEKSIAGAQEHAIESKSYARGIANCLSV